MRTRAGVALAGVCALMFLSAEKAASADELSEKAVKSFMDYAWSLTPQQFSKPDGSTIIIDKAKKNEVLVPVDVAREVIMAGRLSAHAQICDLRDDQIANHRAMMRREEMRQKWTPQQLVYLSQLHLTTVMLLTGRIKLVETEGDKKVIIDETKDPRQTCTDEQRKKVKELIAAYVAASPSPKDVAAANPPKAGGGIAPTATGSVAPKPGAAKAPPAAAADATPAAPAPPPAQ